MGILPRCAAAGDSAAQTEFGEPPERPLVQFGPEPARSRPLDPQPHGLARVASVRARSRVRRYLPESYPSTRPNVWATTATSVDGLRRQVALVAGRRPAGCRCRRRPGRGGPGPPAGPRVAGAGDGPVEAVLGRRLAEGSVCAAGSTDAPFTGVGMRVKGEM